MEQNDQTIQMIKNSTNLVFNSSNSINNSIYSSICMSGQLLHKISDLESQIQLTTLDLKKQKNNLFRFTKTNNINQKVLHYNGFRQNKNKQNPQTYQSNSQNQKFTQYKQLNTGRYSNQKNTQKNSFMCKLLSQHKKSNNLFGQIARSNQLNPNHIRNNIFCINNRKKSEKSMTLLHQRLPSHQSLPSNKKITAILSERPFHKKIILKNHSFKQKIQSINGMNEEILRERQLSKDAQMKLNTFSFKSLNYIWQNSKIYSSNLVQNNSNNLLIERKNSTTGLLKKRVQIIFGQNKSKLKKKSSFLTISDNETQRVIQQQKVHKKYNYSVNQRSNFSTHQSNHSVSFQKQSNIDEATKNIIKNIIKLEKQKNIQPLPINNQSKTQRNLQAIQQGCKQMKSWMKRKNFTKAKRIHGLKGAKLQQKKQQEQIELKQRNIEQSIIQIPQLNAFAQPLKPKILQMKRKTKRLPINSNRQNDTQMRQVSGWQMQKSIGIWDF